MASNYWQHKRRLSSERGRKMGIASQRVQAEHRMADYAARVKYLAEIEIENLPRKQGDALGCLQWADFRTGRVRRWIVRIGDRSDRITLETPGGRKTASHGWTWVMNHLRGFLARRKV